MEPGDSSPTLLVRVPKQLSRHDKAVLKAFAADLCATVGSGRPFTCVLTNDRALQRLNRDFLNHDYPTDVLSFPATGDLAISVDRALAQAAEFGHTLLDELRILMLHGVLHLLGYDHESDRGVMARAERKWRTHFTLPQTLIARAGTPRKAAR